METKVLNVVQKGRILGQQEMDLASLKWINLLQKRARENRQMPYHYLRVNQ